MKIYDILIIGGGPAGYSAALYGARSGFDTLVIEKMAPGGQMALTDTIDNYPAFPDGVDGFTLGMTMQNHAERFGAKTEYCEVVSVDFTKTIKEVVTSNGTFLSKTVIIASGANPRELGIEKENDFVGRGVHYCAHCDGRFYKDKTVIVVGGGNTAAADALHLSKLAKKTYLVHRRDSLRATKIYHEPMMKSENITFLWNSAVLEILSEDRVVGAKIKDLSSGVECEIECDGIFVAIGRKPATEFLSSNVALDENGYIIADETTQTNIPGVFAVGDVRTKAFRQVITAASDGATAIHFAEEYINSL